MKVGDRVTASVVNGTPDGLKIEGTVESVVDDVDTGHPKSVQVATQFGMLMWLDVTAHKVVASPDAAA